MCFKAYKCWLLLIFRWNVVLLCFVWYFAGKRAKNWIWLLFIRPVWHFVRPVQDLPNHTEGSTIEAQSLQDKAQAYGPYGVPYGPYDAKLENPAGIWNQLKLRRPKRKPLGAWSRALNEIFSHQKKGNSPLELGQPSLEQKTREGEEEEKWKTRVCNGSSDFSTVLSWTLLFSVIRVILWTWVANLLCF